MPDRLARRNFDGVDAAVAQASNQQTSPLDTRDRGLRIIGVEGTAARCTDPYSFATSLVEGHDADRAIGLCAPRGARGFYDHQISVDHGRCGASAVRGEQIEFFVKRTLP